MNPQPLPDHPDTAAAAAANDLGTRQLKAGRLDLAASCFRRAIEVFPHWFLPHHNLAQTHLAAGDEARAVDSLRAALALEPRFAKTHFDLAILLLAQGDFAAGWREYDWRFDHGGGVPRRSGYRAPVWDGAPLAGRRLVVWSEQGLGDTLQFARLVPALVRRAGRVTLQVAKPLRRLLATSLDGVRVTADEIDAGDVDLQIPLLSLPRLLGVDEPSIPRAPHLRAHQGDFPDGLPFCAGRRAGRRLGVVWRSGDRYPGHADRNCPPAVLARLADLPGVDLYALQQGGADGALGARAVDLDPWLGDFATTAAIVTRMDLVITVDTAMAHLAGGLGVPVWTLLGARADWRWMRGREDSPWYPTMRLFRQSRPGDWPGVVDAVTARLKASHRG